MRDSTKVSEVQSLPNRINNFSRINLITPTAFSVRSSKSRSRALNLEKEKLYEENQSLKQELNSVIDDNLRLKTKLAQSQKNIDKRINENSMINLSRDKSSVHLIDSLRQTIHDIRQELEEKDKTIKSLKKNIKVTKLSEIISELTVFQEECERLKEFLYESNREKQEMTKKIGMLDKIISEKSQLQSKLDVLMKEKSDSTQNNEENQSMTKHANIVSSELSQKIKLSDCSIRLSLKSKEEIKNKDSNRRFDGQAFRKLNRSPTKKILKLEEESKILKTQNLSYQNEINRLETENSRINDSLKCKESEIRKLKKFLDEAQEKLNKYLKHTNETTPSPRRQLFIDDDTVSDEDINEVSASSINTILKKMLAMIKVKNYDLNA